MSSGDARLNLQVQPHHEQRKICASRAKYREGRKLRAVKVYTINLESRYLLVQGVPAIGVMKELVEQFALYGAIEEYNVMDEYPTEEFTEVYLIKFQRLQSARVAKRKLDERSFFGGLLHVCYAPEFESVQETREKLQDRRRYVARATSEKDHPVAHKREKKPEGSSFTPVQSSENSTHTSSYYPPVQSTEYSTHASYYPPVQSSQNSTHTSSYYPPVQSSQNSTHTSSYYTPVQSFKDSTHASSYYTPVQASQNSTHASSYYTPVQASQYYTPVQASQNSTHASSYYTPVQASQNSTHASSYYTPLQSSGNSTHASSYFTPVQCGDTPTLSSAPSPLAYRHEYYPPLHSITYSSRNKPNDGADHTERTVGLAQGPPRTASSARFMPRTTQLQERQRRREERTKLTLLPAASEEIVIGPKLPEIPKLDLADDSLNISADLIRGKLKEVSTSSTLTRAEPTTAPPVKQRRRI
ncbi:RNA-binding protein 48 [Pyxicephalus adspersus]